MQAVVLAQMLFGLDLPTLLLIGAAVLFLFALVSLVLVLRAQRRQRRLVEQRAREEAERRAREEAERRAREEAERRERLESERRAREEAEERARQEAERREEERRAREEAEQRAREEGEQRAREEEARRAKEEAARMEAARRAKEEAARKEAARKDAARKAQEDAARRAQEEARRTRAEAERKAQEEIERLSRQPQARPQTSPAARPSTGRQPASPQPQVHRPASLAAQQQAHPPAHARPVVEPPVAVPTGPVKKVLLVEDSVTMRKVFALVLAGEGFSLTAVASGQEALPKAREMRPDLVVADLSLDDLDGYEICREIRRDGQLRKTPVLLLHGPSVKLDEARVSEVQASQVLAKPFETDDLLNALRQLTGPA